jgi:hypothetical protein
MRKHAAPLIAAILLLIPVLYAGSYAALVVPHRGCVVVDGWACGDEGCVPMTRVTSYRVAGRFPERLFWPLEQIDRKLRPGAWERPQLLLGLKNYGSTFLLDP